MSPRSLIHTLLLAGVLCVVLIRPAGAYEEATVVSGGTIRGTVRMEGEVPPARIFHLVFSPNIDFCQRVSDGKGNRILREFDVSPAGGLKDTVVAVIGVEKGKPFDYTPGIELENCEIKPFVAPVRNHRPISLVTNDPVTHDIQAYSIKDPTRAYTFQMFNKPMPRGTEAVKEVKFRKGHFIFRTQCGIHDFMQSWGIAVGNPYFAVTGPDGDYTISDVPPGTYDIIAWHPRMKVQVRRVTVPPSGEAVVDYDFDASGVEIQLHDLQTSYRLETWLAVRHLSTPSVEIQTR